MDSCHGSPAPSDPMESVCRHFPPPPHLYLFVYLLSPSRTDSWQSDGHLPRQPVSIGSDGVRLSTFSTPSSAILCCIFTKSLANCLAVSLVAHGLLPSDSVWVYWTSLLGNGVVLSHQTLQSLGFSYIKNMLTDQLFKTSGL